MTDLDGGSGGASERALRVGVRGVAVALVGGAAALAMSAPWPICLGVALWFGGVTGAMDVAERASRGTAANRAALAWLFTAVWAAVCSAQAAFGLARANGAEVETGWAQALEWGRWLAPLGLQGLLLVAAVTAWVPAVVLARLGPVTTAVWAGPLAGALGFTFALLRSPPTEVWTYGVRFGSVCGFVALLCAGLALVVLHALDTLERRLPTNARGASASPP